MGLQFAPNIFAVLQTNNENGSSIIPDTPFNWVASRTSLQEETGIGVPTFRRSMSKQLEDCGRDFVRNTMLEHEKIFGEQIIELHRLYKVQQMLMDELNKQLRSQPMLETRSSLLSSHSPPFRDKHSSLSQQSIDDSHRQSDSAKAETSSQGPTICPEGVFRPRGGTDLNLYEQSYATFQDNHKRSEKESVHITEDEDEESDLELTLCIGSGSGSTKSRRSAYSDPELGLTNPNSVETRQHSSRSSVREEGKGGNEAWYFQALSMNKR